MSNITDARLSRIEAAIRLIPDFPKPGILFYDVTTLFLDHKAFKYCIDIFVERYKDMSIDSVVGIEARGFIFGAPLALGLGAKFVPLRKAGKLPGSIISEEYTKEYGNDRLEMHVDAVQPGERVIIIDDLIATGGSFGAAVRLLERVKAEVVECSCVLRLVDPKFVQASTSLGVKPLFILLPQPPRAKANGHASEIFIGHA